MLGSMDGKHGGVYVEYVSLMVSCYWNILCPFNKHCDVTSRTSPFSIFKSNVIQTLQVRIK